MGYSTPGSTPSSTCSASRTADGLRTELFARRGSMLWSAGRRGGRRLQRRPGVGVVLRRPPLQPRRRTSTRAGAADRVDRARPGGDADVAVEVLQRAPSASTDPDHPVARRSSGCVDAVEGAAPVSSCARVCSIRAGTRSSASRLRLRRRPARRRPRPGGVHRRGGDAALRGGLRAVRRRVTTEPLLRRHDPAIRRSGTRSPLEIIDPFLFVDRDGRMGSWSVASCEARLRIEKVLPPTRSYFLLRTGSGSTSASRTACRADQAEQLETVDRAAARGGKSSEAIVREDVADHTRRAG